jgi:hypothetical protein
MAFATTKFPGGAGEDIKSYPDRIEILAEKGLRCLLVGTPGEEIPVVLRWLPQDGKPVDRTAKKYWYVQPFFRVADRAIFTSEDELTWTRVEQVKKGDWQMEVRVTLPSSGKLFLSVKLPFTLKMLEQVCEKFAPWRVTVAKTAGGLDMPAFRFGTGNKLLWLQANQHVIETSGSYVLSSLMEVLADPATDLKDFTFVVIPSVSVEKMIGDCSFPELAHNINRDWTKRLHPEVQGIHACIQKELAAGKELELLIDMHNGWCRESDSGGNITEYNHGFIEDAYWERRLRFTRAMLAACDYEHPEKIWWVEPSDGSTCFQYGSLDYETLSYTYEFSYFKMYDRAKGDYVPLTQEHLLKLGRQMAAFLLSYDFDAAK